SSSSHSSVHSPGMYATGPPSCGSAVLESSGGVVLESTSPPPASMPPSASTTGAGPSQAASASAANVSHRVIEPISPLLFSSIVTDASDRPRQLICGGRRIDHGAAQIP